MLFSFWKLGLVGIAILGSSAMAKGVDGLRHADGQEDSRNMMPRRLEDPAAGIIAPSKTTCDMYVKGEAIDFAEYYGTASNLIQFTINKNRKLTTNPGAFFYYYSLSPDVTDRKLSISAVDSSSDESFFSVVKNNMKLWLVTGTTCAQVQVRGPDAPRQEGAETKFTIPTNVEVPDGSYYVVSVKYDTDTVENVKNRVAVNFAFKLRFNDDTDPWVDVASVISLERKFPEGK